MGMFITQPIPPNARTSYSFSPPVEDGPFWGYVSAALADPELSDFMFRVLIHTIISRWPPPTQEDAMTGRLEWEQDFSKGAADA